MGEIITRELIYLYDESSVIGVMYNYNGQGAESYYYHRNLQGDVIAIYNANGGRVVEYAYDAFGNCTIVYAANTDLANANPIRYRGYYYDRETGLYYLNARYYNPEWRRFISPDDTAYLDPETPNGLNLYAYCGNDPVNYVDPSGHGALLLAFAIVGISTLIGATSGAIMSGAAYAITTDCFVARDFWAAVAGGAVSGGMMGAFSGVVVLTGGTAGAVIGFSSVAGLLSSSTGSVVEGAINGKLQANPLKYLLTDTLSSAIWGAALGALSGVMAGASQSASTIAKEVGRTLTKQLIRTLKYELVKKLVPNLLGNLIGDFTNWYIEFILTNLLDEALE